MTTPGGTIYSHIYRRCGTRPEVRVAEKAVVEVGIIYKPEDNTTLRRPVKTKRDVLGVGLCYTSPRVDTRTGGWA